MFNRRAKVVDAPEEDLDDPTFDKHNLEEKYQESEQKLREVSKTKEVSPKPKQASSKSIDHELKQSDSSKQDIKQKIKNLQNKGKKK